MKFGAAIQILTTSIPSDVLASSDAFLRTLHLRLPRSMFIAFLLISLVSFLFMAPFAPRGLVNGDAAVYAQQIEQRNIGIRTVHIGYHLLGILFTSLQSWRRIANHRQYR